MRQFRRMIATFAIVVATALSTVTPSAADVASDDPPGTLVLRWEYCSYGNASVIFRRTDLQENCNDALDVEGFVALYTVQGGYKLEICARYEHTMFGIIDPADSNGGSTGDLIFYSDEPYGPCFQRNIGYPVRKFKARWNNSDSSWVLPA